MSNEKIQQLISPLMREVEPSELDAETVNHLREFEREIETCLNSAESGHVNHSLLERATELQIAFAQRHPVAEGIVREIIDILVRIGV